MRLPEFSTECKLLDRPRRLTLRVFCFCLGLRYPDCGLEPRHQPDLIEKLSLRTRVAAWTIATFNRGVAQKPGRELFAVTSPGLL